MKIYLTYECLECLLKQAQSTARILCKQSDKNLQDSFEMEQKAREAVKAIFENLEDFQELRFQDAHNENYTLTPKDKRRLQDLLREFFETQYAISLTSSKHEIPKNPKYQIPDEKWEEDLEENDFEIPPTMLAVLVYDEICKALNTSAPYAQIKKQSIDKARLYKQQFLESLQDKLQNNAKAREVLEFAIRICVLGNVLDYGAQTQFSLEEQAQKILQSPFAVFDLESFMCGLEKAKNLIIIGDNAGENEFDEVLICVLKALYPKLKIFYFVRGAEIINDITLVDLKNTDSAIFHLAEVVDSGVMSPGFIKSFASSNARNLYEQADLILAKGMGNLESMESAARLDKRVFFLFKVKCDVVKNYLQKNLGDFVFWNPNSHAILNSKNPC
ncbi:ARMT1-like domain-containing protein [Helicobacter sp. MIT 05-5294]|uniref:damage-control phosphatase ARMT1 family protein n=1 Tax=Helicobacter sp. MIT 05-5294 TaxID=1548150 RepID=UPI001EE90F02|nr:ARMT1-like domain-containing protein [Helicobacter sp. MIT 05-5294]